MVIVDNGRTRILGGKYEKILNCIRCGACLDVCPVYRKIGGHAYDAVYSGPVGAVLSPLLEGMARHPELVFASSLCGACTEACSARIPLAEYLRELREDSVADFAPETPWRVGFAAYDAVARRPRLWGALETLALPLVRLVAMAGGRLRLPGAIGAWTSTRDLPRPGMRTFRTLWRGGRRWPRR